MLKFTDMRIKYCLTTVLVILSLLLSANAQEADEIFTVYLVRHAEKEINVNIPINPLLTECGRQRAESMATFLKDVNLDAVYSTNYSRTIKTAEPTAKSKDLEVEMYDPKKIKEFANLLLESKEDAFVVGHSNTTGLLAGLLVGEKIGAFDEKIYNRIYQVVIYKKTGRLHILHTSFDCGSSFAQTNWEALFEKDLSNALDKQGVWYYEGDVLTASKDACIFTKSEYENFELDLEFKNEKGTNSGVIVYCTDRKDWIPNSVEIQISDDNYYKEKEWAPQWMCGGIFGHLPPTEHLVKDPGEWNHMNIKCEGQHIIVKLNGKISADMDMAKWTDGKKNPDGSEIPSWLPTPFAKLPTKGYIGLQGKHGEAKIYFKNIRITKL